MAARKKSAGKSGSQFKKGADPRRGRGPQPGAPNAGRPPDEFKALCQRLASRNATVNVVGKILKNPKHPQFMGALKWATENGYGRPKESVEVSGPGGAALTIRVVRERRGV